tara:strand:- start:848 stop:1129 length:282 start_codon:yes stop_codon:yes gene_type:complete
MDFLMNNLNLLAGGGAGALTLWVLKKVPNKELYNWVESCTYVAGVTLTLGLSKWKFTKKIWNSTIEPYFVDLVENTIGAGLKGLLDGLRSDNK